MPRLIVHSNHLPRVIPPCYSNTLKYSSNRYTRPHLLPVISRSMQASSMVTFQIFAPEL
jgi:hypothetical protein